MIFCSINLLSNLQEKSSILLLYVLSPVVLIMSLIGVQTLCTLPATRKKPCYVISQRIPLLWGIPASLENIAVLLFSVQTHAKVLNITCSAAVVDWKWSVHIQERCHTVQTTVQPPVYSFWAQQRVLYKHQTQISETTKETHLSLYLF